MLKLQANPGDQTITIAERTLTNAPPRARGKAHVSARVRDGQSVLQDLHQSGSMRVLFPRPSSPPTAMLLNTAGGVTGGDRFDVSVAATAQAHLTVTTQAAERAYRAMPGQTGHLTNKINVEDGAKLHWLPQETILFNGSALHRRLDVDIQGTAEALIVEPLVFGRPAHGETLTDARFTETVRLRQNGRVTYADGIDLSGDIAAQMTHAARGDSAGAMATLILASPRAEAAVPVLRDHIAQISGICAGASLLAENLCVLRALAHDSFELRRLLLPVLDEMTGGTLPICWRL